MESSAENSPRCTVASAVKRVLSFVNPFPDAVETEDFFVLKGT